MGLRRAKATLKGYAGQSHRERAGLALMLVAIATLWGGSGQAQSRESQAVTWMLEACASYFETGQRAAFDNGPPDGELVAFPGGGVCNGDPVCEGFKMTFIGSGTNGLGAVTVRVFSADVVADSPREASCAAAEGFYLSKADWDPAMQDWLAKATKEGRLVLSSGRIFEGCDWNGRVWKLNSAPRMTPYFVARLDPEARPCGAESS